MAVRPASAWGLCWTGRGGTVVSGKKQGITVQYRLVVEYLPKGAIRPVSRVVKLCIHRYFLFGIRDVVKTTPNGIIHR